MAGAEEKAIAKTTRETVIEAAAQPIEKLVREELDRLEAGRSEAVRARLEPPRSPPRLTVAALASFLRALTLASELNQRHLDFYHLIVAFAADEATRRALESKAKCNARAVLTFSLTAVGGLPRDLKKPTPGEMVITPDLGRWIDAAWQKARERSRHDENQWIEPEDFFTAAGDLRPDGDLGVIRKALDCSPAKTLTDVAFELKTALLERINLAEKSIQTGLNGTRDSVLSSVARSRRGMRAGFRLINRRSVRRAAGLHSKLELLDQQLTMERLPRSYVALSIALAIALGTSAGLLFKP